MASDSLALPVPFLGVGSRYAELTGKTESTAEPIRRKQWRGRREDDTLKS